MPLAKITHLTADQVKEIRTLHIRDKVSYAKLARRYQKSKGAILKLCLRKTYPNVVDQYHPILLSHPLLAEPEQEIPI